jgi:hypothetical protein
MHRYTRLLLTSLAATAFMALAISNASAGRLSVSSETWRITWTSLELSNTGGIGNTVRCPVTLEGNFHRRTITKVERTLIGYITAARVNNAGCTGGRATINRETLPWHLTYLSFDGRLPAITRLRLLLIGAKFRINNTSLTCNATTTATEPAVGAANIEAGGGISSLEAEPGAQIRLEGEGFCSLGNGFFRGPGTVSVLGAATRITVRLI